MARIPYRDIPTSPPYVYRSAVHADLRKAVGSRNASPSLVLGDDRMMGVTRTLSLVSWEFDNSLFDDERSRYSVVVDFYPHGHRDLAENLALMRNEVVKALDTHFSLPDIEIQLYEFDALYHIWRERMEMPPGKGPQLHPSRFRSRAETLAKRIFTVSTGGLFDALDVFGQISLAGVAAGAGIDIGAEGVGSRLYRRVGRFLRTRVAPRVSAELRASITDWDHVRPEDYGNAMLEFLAAFLINVNRSIGRGFLLLVIDAVDEVEDGSQNSLRLRAAFGKLIARCARHDVQAILGGRAPASGWHDELDGLDPLLRKLGQIEVAHVRSALVSAKVTEEVIERVMAALDPHEGGLSAGDFAELWAREAQL